MNSEPENEITDDKPAVSPAWVDITSRPAVDYALRGLQSSLIQVSGMADQKANIILGASLIMITIIVGIASSSGITASLAILGAFAVGSSVCALLTVMPSTFQSSRRQLNAFYFGDIAHLSHEEYERLAERSMADDGVLYAEILRDVHEHSHLLHHGKFRYLRMSYGLFIIGLFATSIAVLLEWMLG